MDSSSDDDDASACKLPEKEKATLARWAPAAQRRMLERLADRPPVRLGRAKPPHKHDVPNLFGSKKQETEIFERLKAAAIQGASTSLILCGHAGCGKRAHLARAIDRLDGEKGVPRFDVAELHGLVHADAATGLRDLARQLDAGRRRNATSRYVDDLGILVEELRRRRAERRAPLLVILHELDAFALQPRQTLLYVLLDAMQSRLGCVIVCGITRDHAVLELFEKRVKSRLQNHHVAFNRPTKVDIVQFFQDRFRLCGEDLGGASERLMQETSSRKRPRDDNEDTREVYVQAHTKAFEACITDPRVAKMLDDSVSCGRSMRWFCRVAQRCACEINEDDPLLRPAHLLEAFRAQEPNSCRAWREALRSLPPAEKALVIAYLKLERIGKQYCLENAAHALARLGQASSQEAFDEDRLLEAQTLLLDKSMVLLSAEARNRRDAHVLRFAPCRLAPALDVDDLWLALRGDDLGCTTTLRQWALNHV
jgi:Cdc6-like AAA superfamily ATPase